MWKKVNNIIGKPSTAVPANKRSVNDLNLGSVIEFTRNAPANLAGMRAQVSAVRTYRFAADTTLTYGITLSNGERYFLSVAYDEEGAYLGVMRELSSAEQRLWFDPDALSFFTEPSTAKTLRCRADMAQEGEWAAERYKKAVDFLVGNVSEGRQAATEMGRKPRRVEYSMLLDESGERALEIEVYPEHGNVRVFVTRYCPEDAVKLLPNGASFDVEEPVVEHETPQAAPTEGVAKILSMPQPVPAERHVEDDDVLGELAAAIQELNHGVEQAEASEGAQLPDMDEEPALFAEDVEAYLAGETASISTRPRKDFRRLSDAEEVAAQAPVEALPEDLGVAADEDAGPIPAFLLEPREPNNLLEEILQPDALQLRVDTKSAYRMLHRSIKSRKPVKEMIREILGLAPSVSDEVIFELPLTQRERQALAIHFQIRPDQPEELEARILKEITKRLS